jgi:hypothetical protein
MYGCVFVGLYADEDNNNLRTMVSHYNTVHFIDLQDRAKGKVEQTCHDCNQIHTGILVHIILVQRRKCYYSYSKSYIFYESCIKPSMPHVKVVSAW